MLILSTSFVAEKINMVNRQPWGAWDYPFLLVGAAFEPAPDGA
jgi:hypothetical protein